MTDAKEDQEGKEAGVTILHYGTLALLVLNIIVTTVILLAVRNNGKIAVTAEAFARMAAEDRVTNEELNKMLDQRDQQIEELRKRLEAMEQQP